VSFLSYIVDLLNEPIVRLLISPKVFTSSSIYDASYVVTEARVHFLGQSLMTRSCRQPWIPRPPSSEIATRLIRRRGCPHVRVVQVASKTDPLACG